MVFPSAFVGPCSTLVPDYLHVFFVCLFLVEPTVEADPEVVLMVTTAGPGMDSSSVTTLK